MFVVELSGVFFNRGNPIVIAPQPVTQVGATPHHPLMAASGPGPVGLSGS